MDNVSLNRIHVLTSHVSSMDEITSNILQCLRNSLSFANATFCAYNVRIRRCIMNVEFYNTQAPKKSANLSVNSELLEQAKKLHINLSQVLEQRLTEIIRIRYREQWLQQNRVAFEQYNQRIEENGVFSDDIREF